MNTKQHIRMTASEIAMGRYMRAPDHPAPAEEFASAFADLTKPREGEGGSDTSTPAATDGTGGTVVTDPLTEPAPPAASEAGATETPPAPDTPGGAGGDAGGEAGADAGTAPAGSPAATSPAGEQPAATPAESAEQILARLADAAGKIAPPPKEEAPAPQLEGLPPLFTDEEQAQLTKFTTDWADESKAIALMQRQLGVQIIDHIFKEIGAVVNPMKEVVDKIALRVHQGDLVDAIGEYDDSEVDKVNAWIETQPSWLQEPMKGVMKTGTAEQVGDLVGRYREATGVAPAPAPGPSGGDTELSEVAKKAAASMAPVGSQRTVVQAPEEDNSDFDGAFNKWAPEFAKKYSTG